MKYAKKERMDIARRVYDGELTIAAAAVRYDLNISSIKGYLRLYRKADGLPPKVRQKRAGATTHAEKGKNPLIALSIICENCLNCWSNKTNYKAERFLN